MVRTVQLHGALGERFGREFRLDVISPAEAIRALTSQVKGFREAIEPGLWRVFRGAPERGRDHLPQELHVRLGDGDDLHIVPVAAGAKEGGFGKVIAGALLVAVSFAVPGAGLFGANLVTGSMVAGLGLSLALGGLGLVLAPTQRGRQRESAPRDTSTLFGDQENVATPGTPVPVVMGECEVGSVVVSAAVHVEERVS